MFLKILTNPCISLSLSLNFLFRGDGGLLLGIPPLKGPAGSSLVLGQGFVFEVMNEK